MDRIGTCNPRARKAIPKIQGLTEWHGLRPSLNLRGGRIWTGMDGCPVERLRHPSTGAPWSACAGSSPSACISLIRRLIFGSGTARQI